MSGENALSAEELHERLRRREREIAAVHRITSALHARTSLDDLERQALHTAIDTVDACAGSIMLHDPKRDVLLFKYVVNPSPEVVERLLQIELQVGQGISGSVFQSGKGRITEDPSADRNWASGVDQATKFQTRNMVTVPLRTTDGQPIGVMQICNRRQGNFDEADLQVLEILSIHAASAIETARLYEQARLAVVVNLIGDISHDVKNLLTPIMGGTQTLEIIIRSLLKKLDSARRDASSVPEVFEDIGTDLEDLRTFYPEAVEMTYDGAQAVQERVREIADAIKGIVSEPHFELASINEVVESVAKPLSMLAVKDGVTVDLSELGDTAPAEIDRKRMYNALYNLINNAIPETPPGGRIWIRARPVQADNCEWLEISVQDTGRGMPEHVRAAMFTDNAVSTKVGGTGLGTRIVKNVVDAHHGTIVVHSEQGKGTEFIMRIPFQQPSPDEEGDHP
jgi:signal transduction histidine kinase